MLWVDFDEVFPLFRFHNNGSNVLRSIGEIPVRIVEDTGLIKLVS